MSVALMRSWLRTFLVQASWSYDRMIGLGIAHASEPLLRSLPGGADGERHNEALARSSEFFNAHPYLAGIAVGAVSRAEHDAVPPEQVRRLRGALVGPLGSVGDKLIWAGVLPTAAGVGLVLAARVGPVAGAAAFLGLYNVAHLYLRTWALRAGWRHGTNVARVLSSPVLQRGMRLAGPVAAVSVGVALPLVAAWLADGLAPNARLGVALVAAVGLVLLRWLLPALGSGRLGFAALGLGLVLGLLWR